jgi:hypothetical protein
MQKKYENLTSLSLEFFLLTSIILHCIEKRGKAVRGFPCLNNDITIDRNTDKSGRSAPRFIARPMELTAVTDGFKQKFASHQSSSQLIRRVLGDIK